MSENAVAVAELITEAARTIRRSTSERLGVPGLTPGRLRALKVLEERGTSRMGELAEVLGMAPRSATAVVDELSDLGLVSRSDDPDDRRATLVTATAKGRRLLQSAEKVRIEVVSQLFAGLPPDQLSELETLLSRAITPQT